MTNRERAREWLAKQIGSWQVEGPAIVTGLASSLDGHSASLAALLDAVERERDTALAQVAALRNIGGEHFGYEPDWDHEHGKVHDWYCTGAACSQPFGKPHLDACTVGPVITDTAAAAHARDERIRREALERAAEICDRQAEIGSGAEIGAAVACAAAIRALERSGVTFTAAKKRAVVR